MKRGRLLARLLLWPLFLLLALLVAVLALPMTEGGTQWLLRQATELARPYGFDIAYERSSGTLLGRLQLDGVTFDGADTRVEAGHLLLHWRPLALLDRRLHIVALEVADVHVVPPPASDTSPSVPQIPDIVLPLTVRLDRLNLDRLSVQQGEGVLQFDHLALYARLDEDGLMVGDLDFRGQGVRVDGDLNMQSRAPHDIAGGLSLGVDADLTGPQIGDVSGQLALRGTALRPQIDLALSAPAGLQLKGELRLDQLQPGFDLTADWPELGWPLQGSPQVVARQGHFNVQGTAEDYRLIFRGNVSGDGIPATVVDLVGTGNLDGLKLVPLQLGLLDGRLRIDGTVDWSDGASWDLDVHAQRINPGLYQPDWPGELGGRAAVSGSVAADGGGLALRAGISEFSGQLRGYPVRAGGVIELADGNVKAQGLALSSGPNRVRVDGRAGTTLDLRFDIEAPDLASLYPGLAGALAGSGRLKGTQAAPLVVANLKGSALVFESARADELQLDVDWRESGGKAALRIGGLAASGIDMNQLTLDIGGTPAAHRLALNGSGPQVDIALAAQGGVVDETWRGKLEELALTQPQLGEWRLREAVVLQLAANDARARRLCMVQGDARLCAEGGWNAVKGIDLTGSVRGIDLARLNERLPGEAKIEGDLAGDFNLSGDPANPSATLELRPGDGVLRVDTDLDSLELAYRNARVSARFADDRGDLDLGFDLGPNGRAGGKLKLGPEQGGRRSISGRVDADFPDLGLVAGFVPALQEVQGGLHVDAALSGNTETPRIVGEVVIANASARVAAAGIKLSDIDLNVRGDGAAPLQIVGAVSSGEGRLDIKGSVDLAAKGGPGVDIRVKGERFEAVQLPEAQVEISPDLRLQGGSTYHLSGKVLVPKAKIELKELPPSTVEVSSDEIVVGRDDTVDPSQRAPQNLTAKVRVELGDKVTFKGFGLSTGLTGALDATVDAKGTGVDGKIELRDGRYKAYGQDLQVERGRLLFAGPPGNPDVDLRAFRESRDGLVKAYLQVRGPLAKPRPRVYSEPTLPEARALAYLLTGKDIDQVGKGEGTNITAAALSLGLARGEPLLEDLSNRLGLDDLRVAEGENGLEDTSLILGKYLNPDLYVGYAQGLFNPAGAVLLRLRLSDRVEVESRSGDEQSVDLFYKHEHN